MEKIKKMPQDNVFMLVPVRIGYNVIESFLQKKLIGKNIKAEDTPGEVTNYAEILGLSIEKSAEEDFDITLNLDFKTLTSFFSNKKGSVKLHAAIGFDEKNQEVKILDYKLQGTGKNWFLNKSLQAVANRFMYNKLKSKMNFELGPPVKEQLEKINLKLENRLEASKGFFASGKLRTFRVTEIIAGERQFLIHVNIEGNALVDIEEINF